MSPADLKKEGAAFDLTLAIGQLAATEQVQSRLLSEFLILGELSLDGHLRPVHGCLPIALAAKNNGFRGVILPAENANEAAVVDGIEVYGFECLTDVIGFLNGTHQSVAQHLRLPHRYRLCRGTRSTRGAPCYRDCRRRRT